MGLFDKKGDNVLEYRVQQAENDIAEVKATLKEINTKLAYLEGANKASNLEKAVDRLAERVDRISTNLAQLQGAMSKSSDEGLRKEASQITIMTGDMGTSNVNTGNGRINNG